MSGEREVHVYDTCPECGMGRALILRCDHHRVAEQHAHRCGHRFAVPPGPPPLTPRPDDVSRLGRPQQ